MRSQRNSTPWFLSAAILFLSHTLHAYPLQTYFTPIPNPPLPAYFDTYNPPIGGAVGTAILSDCNRFAKPNDAITAMGNNLTTNFAAWGQTSAATNAIPFTAAVLRINQRAQFVLPNTLPPNSMYFIWPEDSSQGWGYPVAINHTELWWVGPNQAASGAIVSAYGRNLFYGGLTPTVWVGVQNIAFQQATVLAYNPGKIDFVIPTTFNGQPVASGQVFQIWLHNGHGGQWGWSGPQTLTVQPDQNYGGQQLVPAPIPNGDDTANIQNAINAAENSANKVVQLQAGVYHIRTELSATGVCILGEGVNQTFLASVPLSSPAAIFYSPNAINLTVAAMTIDGSAFTALSNGAVMFFRGSINVHFNDLTILSGPNQVFDTLGAQYVYLGNCNMQGPGSYFGNATQIFINGGNCVIEGTNLNTSSFMMFRAGADVSVTNVNAQQNPSSPSMGRFILFQGYDQNATHAYVGNNTTQNLAVGAGLDTNSGEQVLWESFTALITGGATGGDATHILLDTTPNLGTNPSGYSVVIESGTGTGQFRQIQAISGNDVTVSSPWAVPPDTTSYYEIGFLFTGAYCYGNSFQGMSDYASRDTASCGFEPYSGVMTAVFDSNTVTNCRAGIKVISIEDAGDTSYSHCVSSNDAVQPCYWMDVRNNVWSNLVWGACLVFDNACPVRNTNVAAVTGINVAYNTISNIGGTPGPLDPPSAGVVWSGDPNGQVCQDIIQSNCFAASVPTPIASGPGTNADDIYQYNNQTNCSGLSVQQVRPSGSSQAPTSVTLTPVSLVAAPDPASTSLDAFWTQDARSAARLSLYDVAGNEVASVDLGAAGPGAREAHLDLTRVPNGIFLLHLLVSEGTHRSRWTKVAVTK